MAAISELIRLDSDQTLSFGDYTLGAKAKAELNVDGKVYKVKTYQEITKLECDEVFVYESVPGTVVTGFDKTEEGVTFSVEGPEDAQVTLELEADTDYEISINGKKAGDMKTNLGGKLSVSVELADADSVSIRVTRK